MAAGDYDNDGDVDLYVTNLGRNALYENDGQGSFRNVASAAGLDHPGWGMAALWLDFDADGDLDLFLVNYVEWDLASNQVCRGGDVSTYCSPLTFDSPTHDVVLPKQRRRNVFRCQQRIRADLSQRKRGWVQSESTSTTMDASMSS